MIRDKRVFAASLLMLGGCSMVPRYVRPAAPVPATLPATSTEAAPPTLSYSDIFRDPHLQRLIEQALANNRDLRIAAANIAAARAQYRIVAAAELPTVGTSTNVTFSDSGTGRTNIGGTPVSGGARTNYSVNAAVSSFEVDLFGRLRAQSEAEQNRYFATEAGARATRLTLIGDIATTWLQYAADKSLLRIAEDTAANARRSVDLTRARLDGGIAARTDLAQAQTVLATAESDLAQQQTALAQDVNALTLLVGTEVEAALLPDTIDSAAPSVAELPSGLDSAILLRRPDVVQSEYQLRAANAQIGVARAALFPRISLTTVAGLASNGLSRLFTTNAFNYSAAPSISYPLFSGGAGKAAVRQARAQFDAAVAGYERTIQVAFREVADALARRATIAAQTRAQEQLVAASADNFRLSDARYRGGVDSFLQNLDAQRSLYGARRSLVATQLTAATNLVTLYRTLGGDTLIDATPAGPVPVSPGTAKP